MSSVDTNISYPEPGPTYTPPSAHATWWRLTHSDGSTKEALGQTAFYACSAAKWQVGEVVKFEQIPGPSDSPVARISAALARRKAELQGWEASYPEGHEYRESCEGKLYRAKTIAHVRYLEDAARIAADPLELTRQYTADQLHRFKALEALDAQFKQARLQGQIDAAEEIG